MSSFEAQRAPRGWIAEWVDAAGRILAFRKGGTPAHTPTRRPRGKGTASKPIRRKSAQVQKLAREGLGRAEIARRTGLSQDIVAMLLNLEPSDPAESAANGTFFRILQARMAG